MKSILKITTIILVQALLVNCTGAGINGYNSNRSVTVNYLSPRLNISVATTRVAFERARKQEAVKNKSLSEQFFEKYDGTQRYLWKGQRVFDISICLLFSVPVIAVTLLSAVLIKVIDKNGSFITQKRFRYKGKLFTIWKLQTMKNRKITGLGYILRKLGIDEFPQFWNILKGEMTIFGPRPKLFDENLSEEYKITVLKREQGLASLLGAIVGPGQGYQPYDAQIFLSEYELKNWSFTWPFKRILCTVHAIIFPEKREQRLKIFGLSVEKYPALKQILLDKQKRNFSEIISKPSKAVKVDKKITKDPQAVLGKQTGMPNFPQVIDRLGLDFFAQQSFIQQAI